MTWKFLAACSLLSVALGVVHAGVSGSVHDLRGAVGNDAELTPGGTGAAGEAEICIPCHTPHNGSTSAPLWNHSIVSGSSFTPYSSTGTLDASVGAPSGVSLLCLSCHDGVSNIDAFGGATGDTTIGNVPGNLGSDLTNDHPISFTYDAALATADGELFDPTTTASGLPAGGNIDDDMLFGASNNQMECASCHDVHDNTGEAYLLRKSNTASALCLTCHDK